MCKGYDEQHIVQFENVQFVYPLKNKISISAFMLELKDKIVKAWWAPGTTCDFKFESKVKSVISTATYHAYTAVLENGTVKVRGHASYGGSFTAP